MRGVELLAPLSVELGPAGSFAFAGSVKGAGVPSLSKDAGAGVGDGAEDGSGKILPAGLPGTAGLELPGDETTVRSDEPLESGDGSGFVSAVAGGAETKGKESESCTGVVKSFAARMGEDDWASACPMAGEGSEGFGLASIATRELVGTIAAPGLSAAAVRSPLKFDTKHAADRLVADSGLAEVAV